MEATQTLQFPAEFVCVFFFFFEKKGSPPPCRPSLAALLSAPFPHIWYIANNSSGKEKDSEEEETWIFGVLSAESFPWVGCRKSLPFWTLVAAENVVRIHGRLGCCCCCCCCWRCFDGDSLDLLDGGLRKHRQAGRQAGKTAVSRDCCCLRLCFVYIAV